MTHRFAVTLNCGSKLILRTLRYDRNDDQVRFYRSCEPWYTSPHQYQIMTKTSSVQVPSTTTAQTRHVVVCASPPQQRSPNHRPRSQPVEPMQRQQHLHCRNRPSVGPRVVPMPLTWTLRLSRYGAPLF